MVVTVRIVLRSEIRFSIATTHAEKIVARCGCSQEFVVKALTTWLKMTRILDKQIDCSKALENDDHNMAQNDSKCCKNCEFYLAVRAGEPGEGLERRDEPVDRHGLEQAGRGGER